MSTILIVDDESDICELFEFEFESAGFVTFTASNITDAKEILQAHQIDVVLSDVRMPGGSGIDLLEWVRLNCAHSLIFLLMTGYSDVSLERAFLYGAHGLFYKPIDLSEVTTFAQHSLEQTEDSGPANRKSARKRIECEATLHFPQSSAVSKGKVIDLSRGGVFVALPGELPALGQNLHFRFLVNLSTNTEISGEGVVRWIHPGSSSENHPQGVGIEFTKLDASSIEDLFALLTKLEIVPLKSEKSK